jgi:hypothetical protein
MERIVALAGNPTRSSGGMSRSRSPYFKSFGKPAYYAFYALSSTADAESVYLSQEFWMLSRSVHGGQSGYHSTFKKHNFY